VSELTTSSPPTSVLFFFFSLVRFKSKLVIVWALIGNSDVHWYQKGKSFLEASLPGDRPGDCNRLGRLRREEGGKEEGGRMGRVIKVSLLGRPFFLV
jgi:hypothetical protein